MRAILCSLLVLLSLPLQGRDLGAVEARGAVIYWKNINGGIQYAWVTEGAAGAGAPTFPQLVDPIFSYGLEGSIRYFLPRRRVFVEVAGGRVTAVSKDKVSVPPPPAVLGPSYDPTPFTPLNRAFAQQKSIYAYANATAGVLITSLGFPIDVFVLGGARYAQVSFEERIRYVPLAATPDFGVFQSHSFKGVGPRIGMLAQLRPFAMPGMRGLRLELELATSGIIGAHALKILSPSGNLFGLLTVNGVEFFPKQWGMFPAVDARVASTYDLKVGFISVGIEVGYAFNYYFALDRRVADSSIGTPDPVRRDVGYGGPYTAIRGGF